MIGRDRLVELSWNEDEKCCIQYITRGKIKMWHDVATSIVTLIYTRHIYAPHNSVIFLVIWWLVTILLWGLWMAPGFGLALALASRPWARPIPANRSEQWLVLSQNTGLTTTQIVKLTNIVLQLLAVKLAVTTYITKDYSMQNMTIHSCCMFIKEPYFQMYKFWKPSCSTGHGSKF